MKRLVYAITGWTNWTPEGPSAPACAHTWSCQVWMPRRLPKDALTSVLRVYGPLRVLGGGR